MISGIRLALAALGMLLAGCDGTTAGRIALCQRVIPALEDRFEAGQPIEARRSEGDPGAVILTYRAAPDAAPHRLICRFARGGDNDADALIAVSSAAGDLAPAQLAMLKIWLGLSTAPPDVTPATAGGRSFGAVGYLAQQLINGLVLGAIYGLIALGYAQVFSLLEIVNFAFGELYMMGAYLGLATFVLLAGGGLDHGVPGIAIALVGAIGFSLPWGWAIERVVYRPLGLTRLGPTQAGGARLIPLVSAIGLSIALQNFVRLAQGNRNKWLPPMLEGSLPLGFGQDTNLRIGVLQIAIMLGAAVLCVGLSVTLRHSRFGREQRACAQDRIAAALLGVDVDRVISRTFMLASGLAAIAGVMALLYYGEADPSMGTSVGFKALSAAVLGGIGSLGGAMLGGLLIGLAESLWSGYFDGAYRDAAIFAALIATLILRPAGLFGDPGKTSS